MKAKEIAKLIRKSGERPTHADIKAHEQMIKKYAEEVLDSVLKEISLYYTKDHNKGNPFDNAKRNLK